MEMKVTFPGGKKVNAEYKGFTIATDQPERAGGQGSAPAPFDLFLASLATCAGIYVKGFCDQRGISSEGIELVQNLEYNTEKQMIGKITIDIRVPEDFPEKYHDALIKSASLCAVKKHIQDPPEFEINTVVNESA
ncbi:MAG: osmotically inducible protein C [Ectothiorhodospiraceae bacterium]|nr:osmotically inducible protein C [Ectothiorhodospiraceae bacterium]